MQVPHIVPIGGDAAEIRRSMIRRLVRSAGSHHVVTLVPLTPALGAMPRLIQCGLSRPIEVLLVEQEGLS